MYADFILAFCSILNVCEIIFKLSILYSPTKSLIIWKTVKLSTNMYMYVYLKTVFFYLYIQMFTLNTFVPIICSWTWNAYIIRMNLDFTSIKERTENILTHNAKKGLDTLIRSRPIIKTYFCLHVSIKVTCISFDWNFIELKFTHSNVNNSTVV